MIVKLIIQLVKIKWITFSHEFIFTMFSYNTIPVLDIFFNLINLII